MPENFPGTATHYVNLHYGKNGLELFAKLTSLARVESREAVKEI
jgi:hypothetical protein